VNGLQRPGWSILDSGLLVSSVSCILCSPLYPGIHNKAGAVPAQERFGEEPSEEELGSLFLPHVDGGLFNKRRIHAG